MKGIRAIAMLALTTLAVLPGHAQSQAQTQEQTPAQTQAQAQAGSEALQYFSEPSESGGISYNIGDRFNGPGVLTIGRLGTKKQLVLPAGEWVALAAVDYRNPGGTDMTALAFGNFSGKRLRSFLGVIFNRNVTQAQTWTDFNQCAQEDSHALLRISTLPSAMRSECVLVKAQGSVNLARGHAGDQILKSLARLGAVADGPAMASTVMLAEKRWGFIRIYRADYLSDGKASDWWPAAVEASPVRGEQAKALLAWVERYRQAANNGFRRTYDDHDLEANLPKAGWANRPGLAQLGDFSPADAAGLAAR